MNKLDKNTLNLLLLWPIMIGMLAMYLPMYYKLANGMWKSEEFGHGPIVLLVVAYLFWDNREYLISQIKSIKTPLIAYIIFALGLLFFIIGKTQDILFLEIGSQMWVLTGLIWAIYGTSVVKKLWFPIFFIFFMIPLPGFFIDAVTQPMKMAVSYVAENVLYTLGYPISRSGVLLQIGQYQLLVADACAGMHTLISLEALGLLYLNIIKSTSYFRNISLALLIIPISFTANVIRVIVLTLVTYYFGDAVGQGFIHGFAGMFLFIVALFLIIFVDSILQYFDKRFFPHKSAS